MNSITTKGNWSILDAGMIPFALVAFIGFFTILGIILS